MNDPERALWSAVLHQAIDDACNWRKQYEVWLASDKAAHKRADAEGISPEHRAERAKQRAKRLDEIKHYRNQARAWLLRDRDDFGLVCNLAGLDPAAVRDRIRAVAAGQDWRRDADADECQRTRETAGTTSAAAQPSRGAPGTIPHAGSIGAQDSSGRNRFANGASRPAR